MSLVVRFQTPRAAMPRQRVQQIRARVPNLYPPLGLFQATSSAADTLILLFAAHVLFSSRRELGFLDATDTLGYTLAAVVLGICALRLSSSRSLLVLGFALTALPILLLSVIRELWMAYVLSAVFGIFWALPASMVPVYLCSLAPRSRWGEVYGKLSVATNLGGALGMAFAWGWLLFWGRQHGAEVAQRTLFLVLGGVTAVAALGALGALGGSKAIRRPARGEPAGLSGSDGRLAQVAVKPLVLDWLGSPAPSVPRPPSPALFSGAWIVFFLLTGLLYVGLGMSFSGSMLYLLDGLKAPGTVIFGAALVFRLTAWPVSLTAGRLLGYLTPLRMQQFAGSWRFVAALALSLVTLLPEGPWSPVLVVLLLVLCGLSGGVLGVTGLAAATEMAPRRYQGTLIFLFNAVSNGAVALGAWLSGVVAATGGFPLLLMLSGLCIGGALWLWRRY